VETTTWLAHVEALAAEHFETPQSPNRLTVLFDPGCALCRRCRDWMAGQPSYVPLSFVSATSQQARERFPGVPWLGDELVVVGDHGELWVGAAAFLICLWALEPWREWSYRLASPTFAPLAERFFLALSSRRRALSLLFPHRCSDGVCGLGPHAEHR
jgi:predicted DCC family thiol-disulfide oxidoreductase YuxK